MTERATPQQAPKKLRARDHESFGSMTLLTVFIPLVGFILGIVYLAKSKPIERKLGEHLLSLSILVSLLAFLGWYILTANRRIESVTPYATPAVVVPVEEPSTWDIEAAYDKITTGMTKSEVADATGRQSNTCTESEVMGSKYEYCSYGDVLKDKASIMVTFIDGVVNDKIKSTY